MKIITVLGARPQFIKAATVSRTFKSAGITEFIIHTGQHFDANMSDVFFEEMDIPKPHHQLKINNLGHGAMTGRMMEKIEEILDEEKPNAVLVYGDTNSTLAGALAAELHIPVCHVEAGLRSFDMRMPEEINRILTDRLSKILFCPTETAILNLSREGFKDFDCLIEKTGDVMYDAVLFYKEKAKSISTILTDHKLSPNGFVLATLHRAENTDDPSRLKSICDALNEINKIHPVILPLHPRTRTYLRSLQIDLDVKIIDPASYFDMLVLLDACKLVITDSGGLQKEAYFFEKFCLTLRDQTEWVELVNAGANEIVGADTRKIIEGFKRNKNRTVESQPLYGSGDAAKKIVASMMSSFSS